MPNYTQGAAALYPGLCSSALTARAGQYIFCEQVVRVIVMARYCLPGSRTGTTFPRASPPCSSPLAQIASKSDTLRLVQPYRLFPLTSPALSCYNCFTVNESQLIVQVQRTVMVGNEKTDDPCLFRAMERRFMLKCRMCLTLRAACRRGHRVSGCPPRACVR